MRAVKEPTELMKSIAIELQQKLSTAYQDAMSKGVSPEDVVIFIWHIDSEVETAVMPYAVYGETAFHTSYGTVAMSVVTRQLVAPFPEQSPLFGPMVRRLRRGNTGPAAQCSIYAHGEMYTGSFSLTGVRLVADTVAPMHLKLLEHFVMKMRQKVIEYSIKDAAKLKLARDKVHYIVAMIRDSDSRVMATFTDVKGGQQDFPALTWAMTQEEFAKTIRDKYPECVSALSKQTTPGCVRAMFLFCGITTIHDLEISS